MTMKMKLVVLPVSLFRYSTHSYYSFPSPSALAFHPHLSASLHCLPLHPMSIPQSLFPYSSSSSNFSAPPPMAAACVDSSTPQTSPLLPSRSRPSTDRLYNDDHHHKYVNLCRPNPNNVHHLVSNHFIRTIHTVSSADDNINSTSPQDQVALTNTVSVDNLWLQLQNEARSDIIKEPILAGYYHASILNHPSLETALANHLSMKLSNPSLPSGTLYDLFLGVLLDDREITTAVKDDLLAVKERDPACISYVHCFLNFKGFLACQAHRVGHKLWSNGRKILALLIQNRISEVFAVDIHPGAKFGRGILLDHATGVVVGETAVIGDNVSILHNVTLGGTGKVCGDRHPKIGDGVLIGAGTCILGNVNVGEGAKIGAGSVVVKEVQPRTTAVGNPARPVGGKDNPIKLDKMPGLTMDHTSHISEWSDYVI